MGSYRAPFSGVWVDIRQFCSSCDHKNYMAVSMFLWVSLRRRALLFGVYVRASCFCKLPSSEISKEGPKIPYSGLQLSCETPLIPSNRSQKALGGGRVGARYCISFMRMYLISDSKCGWLLRIASASCRMAHFAFMGQESEEVPSTSRYHNRLSDLSPQGLKYPSMGCLGFPC